MRKLKITRNKTFVGCAGRIKFYIEDPAGDLDIKGVMCRKLGELKNGEEAEFEIEHSALSLFAIADKATRNYCVDCYKLPHGKEDISLSGKCRFNPTLSNAFIFDGNDTEEAKAGRKSGKKRGLIILLAAMLIGGVVGFSVTAGLTELNNSRAKVFDTAYFSITLTEGFSEQSVAGVTKAYASKNMALSFKRVEFNSSNRDLGVAQYARTVVVANGLTADVITEDGLTYFTASATSPSGIKMFCHIYAFKTDDAFWIVEFNVRENHKNKYADTITEYASGITFK